MQTLRLTPNTAEPNVPSEGIVCHDVRNPAQRSEVLARKGTTISADEHPCAAEARRSASSTWRCPSRATSTKTRRPRAWLSRLPGGPSPPSRRIGSGEFCQRRARHAAHQQRAAGASQHAGRRAGAHGRGGSSGRHGHHAGNRQVRAAVSCRSQSWPASKTSRGASDRWLMSSRFSATRGADCAG